MIARMRNHPRFFYWDEATQRYIPEKLEIFSKVKGHRLMNKRKGQTYHTKQLPGGTGMLRQINNGLKAAKKNMVEEEKASLCPTSNTSAATLERLYFFKQSALTNAITRRTRINTSGYYLIPQWKRMIAGRQEWCYVDTN